MNVGIIGCGVMGAVHAETAALCGLHVAVCFDILTERAETLARAHGARPAADPREITEGDDLQIVVVASPTSSHSAYVISSCEAGKNVFCEVPLARTAEDAQYMRDAAEKFGVKLFAAHITRYSHAMCSLEAQIAENKIGSVGFVKTYRGGACPRGQDGWYRDFEESGGVVFDSMIHDFDWIRHAFGTPQTVFCQNLLRTSPDPLDYAMATVSLSSGMIAQAVGSWAHPAGHRVAVEVVGDAGIARYDSADAPITVTRRSAGEAPPGVPRSSSPTAKGPYHSQWEDFLSWIADETAPRISPDDAVMAVRIAEAALQSAAKGAPVTVKGLADAGPA